MSKVSIALPIYNHEQYFAETLNSILGQTYQDFEIVMIDDGSTDESAKIAETYAIQYPNKIRFIKQNNQGLEATVNRILSITSGNFIAFTASDDLWYPSKLDKQMEIFDKDFEERIGVVYTYGEHLNQDPMRTRGGDLTRGIRGKIFKELFVDGCFFIPCSIVIRKSALDKVGKFNHKYPYCSDYDILLRIAAAGYEFDFVPEILAIRRIHTCNMSSNQLKSNENNREMILDIASRFKILIEQYNIDINFRLAKLDCELIRHYFSQGEMSRARNVLFSLLRKYPSLVLRSKSNITYFVMSFFPNLVLSILKGFKPMAKLFKAK